MGRIETVTVQHPDAEGQVMIINASEFDEKVHKRVEPKAEESKDGAGATGTAQPGGGGASDPNALPAGYVAKHKGGGKYVALVNDQPLKDSAGEALFENKESAEAALREFAAAQAGK